MYKNQRNTAAGGGAALGGEAAHAVCNKRIYTTFNTYVSLSYLLFYLLVLALN